jgi:ABC-type sugar transport system permease subunit
MKSKVKALFAKIRSFFRFIRNKLSDFFKIFKNLLRKFRDFYQSKISPIVSKIWYFLTHNVIINISNTHVIFCKSIKIRITNKRRQAFYGYLFIFLWLVGFLIFTFYPMFFSLYLTFQEAFFNVQSGITGTFIAFTNYKNILSDATLLPLFAAYVGKIILSVPVIIVFSIFIALLINQPIKGKGIFRTVFFLPVVIATGPVLGELVAQGATSLPSLTNSQVTLTVLESLPEFIGTPLELLFDSLLLTLWYAGIPILIFLAAIQKINKEIYEAAEVDGASPWDTFWKITLPSIKPMISVTVIYIVVSMSLYVEPDGILELARKHMINGAAESLFWNGYGYSATISWIYFLLMVLIILLFVGLLSIKRRRRS